MYRPQPGHYITVSTAAEPFKAFVPAPLPPEPPLVWSAAMRHKFDAALVALGRLDSVTALLPNAALLLYSFVRKEAVLSSQIEGTQSSLADLMLYEIDEEPGVPVEDAREVSRCVAALERGLKGRYAAGKRGVRPAAARGSLEVPGSSGTISERRTRAGAAAAQGCAGARAVRDHTSIPGRQRPHRAAPDRTAARGRRCAA